MESSEGQTVTQDTSVDSAAVDQASASFVGRWNHLVSQTNWEKGRIIFQWREALAASDAPMTEYSDEAWSRRVGGVTGQHVGRLRRVYQRFGQAYQQFDGLFWSHFQAAIDWDDAEMWLEGAVQNRWSVSQMRNRRWETMGAVAAEKPNDDDIVVNELDEDFEPALNESPGRPTDGAVDSGPLDEGPDFGDEPGTGAARVDDGDSDHVTDGTDGEDQPTVRPFESLSALPEDLATAFEAFKLAILRHKLEGWQQIQRADVLASLDALKQLAIAPSD